MALSVRNLCLMFPGQSSYTLDNISVELKNGDFCVVIGNNGSGKSTLIETIRGANSVEYGSINIDGIDVTNRGIERNAKLVSSVAQNTTTGTVSNMSLLENFMLSILKLKKRNFTFYNSSRKMIEDIIYDFEPELLKHIDTEMKFLSGGQRQSIATLMALHSNPTLLLLDEHTSALDPKMQDKLMKYTVKKITENRTTTLMITHNIKEAITHGNRLIMLQSGKIIMDVSGEVKRSLTMDILLEKFNNTQR